MQLRYENTVKSNVITIELETSNFTMREQQALEKFGEPIVKLEKVYRGSFPVSIEKRIRTGFKVKVKFDGTGKLTDAVEAANEFFEEIQEKVSEAMASSMEKLEELESGFDAKKGFIDIKY